MSENGALAFLLKRIGERFEGHRPWPRVSVDRAGWQSLIEALAHTDWDLLALWGEPTAVHVAIGENLGQALAVVSLNCPDRHFASLSTVRPGAIRLERMAQDLYGLTADGLTDPRPWLDYGWWGMRQPLAEPPLPPDPNPQIYHFLPVEGEGLHQIPVGPVHAGIIEPGHFRFTCNGETVVRLEERLGWVHKGIEGLVAGIPIARAARILARLSGDATVASSFAFARAVEAALGIEAPARAVWLRALMAEWERIANHVGDIGAICNDAAFGFMLAECGRLREMVAQANDAAFGHRLMMDCVIPGGVAVDLAAPGTERFHDLVKIFRLRLARLIDIYDSKPSLLDRTVTTGVVGSALVERFAAGGPVGRASGRGFDSRRAPGYPPYDQLQFTVAVVPEGDVDARIQVRFREAEQSLALIDQILAQLVEGGAGAPGALTVPLPHGAAGEGIALVEGFRGDYLVWVRIAADGTVQRCHPRDPSWFQWPLLEASIEGNIVADFPLCNKSFNCSYSGHDL